MKPAPLYRRLPGSAGLVIRQRLWLGPDHALLVRSSVISQDYRRFYFADIEAIVIAEIESASRFYGMVLSIMAGVFTLGLAVSGYTAWAVFCALVCIVLSVFTWTRPLVRCSLKTRVGTQPLPCLKQLQAARRVAAILQAEIQKVQGLMPGDSLASHPHVDGAAVPPPIDPYDGRLHYVAFCAMFAVVALTVLRLNVESAALSNTLAATHVSMVLLAVIAAVKQHGSGLAAAARMVIALTLAWAAVSYIAEQVIVATTIQAAFRTPMSFDYWRDPVRDVAIANAIAYSIFGAAGLFALLSRKQARAA